MSTRQTFDQLIASFQQSAGQPASERWLWLEAAHVTGQAVFQLHWRSHVWMLRFARQQHDHIEVTGQILRLALVPLGHLLQRLPFGNTGRSHVSALKPMVVPAAVAERIRHARQDGQYVS